MITDHFFNLIQCYSEQGVCYFRDYAMNPMMLPILWIVLVIYVIGFMSFFMSNAVCSCGEHFFFIGFLQSFVWFIVTPYRTIKEMIFE